MKDTHLRLQQWNWIRTKLHDCSLKSMALVTIQYKERRQGLLEYSTQGHRAQMSQPWCAYVSFYQLLSWTDPLSAPMTLECILAIEDLLMGRGSQRWRHYAIASGPVVQHAKHLISSTRWEFTYKAMLHKIHQYKSLMEMNYSLQAIKILLMIRWRYLRLW